MTIPTETLNVIYIQKSYILINIHFLNVQEWKKDDLCEDFKMPLKNEFIVTDFNLVPIDKNVMKLFIIWF